MKTTQHPQRLIISQGLRELVVQCFCGAVRRVVALGPNWSEERDAIDAAIADCGHCKPVRR